MATYSNTVVDDSGYLRPLPGALVYLFDSAGTLVAGPVTTDAFGNFTITAPDGVYTVEVRLAGVTLSRYSQIIGNPAQYVGPAGPSNNTRVNLAALKAAAISDLTSLYDRSPWYWTTGDFTGQADDTNVVKANSTPLTTGAWVRQSAAGVTSRELGGGAVTRTSLAFVQDRPFSAKGRGAIADGALNAVDGPAIQAAVTEAYGTDGAQKNATALLTRGAYRLAAGVSITLPRAKSHITGEQGSFLYGNNAPVLAATGASYVLSSIKNLNLAGGTYCLDASTSGEIASLVFEDVGAGDYSTGAFRFAGGVTSSKFNRLHVNGSISSGAGFSSLGGINNNCVVRDSDFTNCYGPAFRIINMTQGWLFDNIRIEGAGRAGVAQYNFDAPVGVRIIGGWSETSHEFLLAINNGNDGVVVDGLFSIGSQYAGSGGIVASKFSAGNDRVIFGTNWWYLPTTAPARCFINGVNKNLLTDASVTHTRALASSEHAVARKRSFAAVGDQTFSFLHLKRTDASNVATNQQVLSATMFVTLSGYDGGGVARWGVWRVELAVHSLGSLIDDPNPYITTTLVQGNVGAITLTVQKSTAVTATDVDLQIVFAGVNTGLNNYVQYEMNMRNMSSTEAGRFVLTVV